MKLKIIFLLLVSLVSLIVAAQNLTTDIRLNQVGFLPNSIKVAAVVNTQADSFKIMTSNLSATVFNGQFLPAAYYGSSGEDVKIADFTMMTEPGEYVLVVNSLGKSVSFVISSYAFSELSKATLKSYYYNRASTPIIEDFAGAYARAEGHPDTEVVVLPSAASENRPAGTVISTPGGWYDAGDYNKYIVSSGISVFTLLSAYETYPEYYNTLNTNIPESNNNIPDILDEALWNIKWMMTMQDEDGGVYNKTTEANFSGFVMPSEVTATRYVCAKGTAATLDFAAIMAMTARIYKKYDSELASQAQNQAIKAWHWAKANPNITFNNPSSSGIYPAVNTGGYGDSVFDDEFSWCASELYITTKEDEYYNQIDFNQYFGMPGWPTVRTLGLLSLIVNKDSLTPAANINLIKSKFIDVVSGTKDKLLESPYRIPGDFYYWAGNNAFANWGMLFMQAYRLTRDVSYYNAGVATLDYLMGKNATTYCFVTGQGTKSPMHIHHRISSADGVTDPIPGLLVCGADGADVYDCGAENYPSTFPAQSYLDSECSFSTNEIAIGINAPLVFLAGAIQSEYQECFLDSMPHYFNISANAISLPSTMSEKASAVIIETNTNWSVGTSANWIVLSNTTGSGSGVFQVNSDGDNPDDAVRVAKIYVYSNNILTDSVEVAQNGKHRTGPYFDTPMPIPGKIEAENYDYGEINESWYDTDAANNGGAYRTDGVDISSTWDNNGSYNLGWIATGEWLKYTVNVNDTLVNIEIRVATWNSGGKVKIELDDKFVTEADVPVKQAWVTVKVPNVKLEMGQNKILKFSFIGGFDLNWVNFMKVDLSDINPDKHEEVKIYPIPAKNRLNITGIPSNTDGYIEILSLDGKSLKHYIITNGDSFETFDVSGLKSGMYILKANFATKQFSEKFIID